MTEDARDLSPPPHSYLLHNNIWNTNYPAWFPFDDAQRGNVAWRLSLEAGPAQ